MVRLLVAEGNSNEGRRQLVECAGRSMAEGYADTLRAIDPNLSIDQFAPADQADVLPSPLGCYDGVIVTGSSLHVYRGEPAVTRQIDFLREVFALGIPVFGSCWGLQLGVVAAGGHVAANPKGREVPFARGVTLSDAGRTHPMHQSRPAAFDALAIHLDVVTELPPNAIVTASNGLADVQAVEFRSGRSSFWGVQFHPEFELPYMAALLRRNAPGLIEEGSFRNETDLNALLRDLDASRGEDHRSDRISTLPGDISDSRKRTTEIANWLKQLSARS